MSALILALKKGSLPKSEALPPGQKREIKSKATQPILIELAKMTLNARL